MRCPNAPPRLSRPSGATLILPQALHHRAPPTSHSTRATPQHPHRVPTVTAVTIDPPSHPPSATSNDISWQARRSNDHHALVSLPPSYGRDAPIATMNHLRPNTRLRVKSIKLRFLFSLSTIDTRSIVSAKINEFHLC